MNDVMTGACLVFRSGYADEQAPAKAPVQQAGISSALFACASQHMICLWEVLLHIKPYQTRQHEQKQGGSSIKAAYLSFLLSGKTGVTK